MQSTFGGFDKAKFGNVNANNKSRDRNEDNTNKNINETIQAHIQIQGGRTTCVEADRGMCSHG